MLTRVAHRRAILPVLALALAGPAAADHYDITPVMVENLTPMPGGGVINGMTRAAGSTDAGEILVGGWVWDDPDLDHKVFLM